ncbi:MAG: hypothetical protein PHG65_00880 [Kiritimatiellae bacterium]|nr:hypothetical protein [Kiritimatiellia bacterium]
MIWDAQKAGDPAEAFREAARNEVLALAPDLRNQEAWLADWADVFCSVCHQGYPDGLVPSDHFGVLLAQSLWMMNRHEAAEAALRKWCSEDAALLCRLGEGLSHTRGRLALHGAGLLRGGQWAFMGGGRGWIIDLDRMAPDSRSMMELTACQLLRGLILELASVWDDSSGEGWLGLKGIEGWAAGLAGKRGSKRRVGEEMFQYAESVLGYAARQRGWARAPSLKKLAI